MRAETLDALDLACEAWTTGRPARSAGSCGSPVAGASCPCPASPGRAWTGASSKTCSTWSAATACAVTEGFGTVGHGLFGEHPLGLAVDIAPGAGGTWADVSRLARWAEPRQNHPRLPFRWVGFNGDYNHGHPSVCKPSRGCAPHLHLSWAHSPARPRRPARTVWVFGVR